MPDIVWADLGLHLLRGMTLQMAVSLFSPSPPTRLISFCSGTGIEHICYYALIRGAGDAVFRPRVYVVFEGRDF